MTRPAPRIIVHAGFHKTGTTSLQGFLERNRDRLAPHVVIHVKTDLGPVRYLGRWYGQRPVFWRRWLFRAGWRRFLRRIPDAPTIVISRESFSGMMPGFTRNGRTVTGYGDMAVPLAREITRGLRRRFGPECRIELLYTVRDGEDFLRSLHGHILRSSPLTQDWPQFRARFSALPDLREEAHRIAQAIAPVRVHIAALEDFQDHPLGPGGAVADLLNLPDDTRAGLRPPRHGNPGPTQVQRDALLALNRAGGSRRALRRAKNALLGAGPAADATPGWTKSP